MQIHRDLDQLPDFKNAVVTIGTFDGVHRGHQKIIQQIKKEAKKNSGESVIVTFYPHPRQVLAPSNNSLQLLNTLDEKILLLQQQQIDHLIVVPFTKAFSQLSATEYVRDFLVAKLQPKILIIGYDHHFGHNREGDIHVLHRMASQFNFKVEEIPAQVIHDLTVSSTKIRKNVKSGKIKLANELLGYPYFISGKVVHGDKRGSALGFPTANIAVEEVHKLIPTDGIYAAKVMLLTSSANGATDKLYNGAINIGHAPTFGKNERRIEAFIMDFDRSIYDETILLRFYDFIRPDQKFAHAEELIEQMHKDVEKIKMVLDKLTV